MAKVSFTKLGLTKRQDIKTAEFNGQEIEIKQYLPIQEKLELISRIISRAIEEEENFMNPGKLSVFFKLEIIYAYTNINFTEKQKEDFLKTFDLLEGNGICAIVLTALPKYELEVLESWTTELTQKIYEYKNSIRGILSSMQSDYNDLNFDITALQEKLKDPESLALLKELTPYLNLA